MITFDEKGHVYPYEVIELSLEQFKQVFVEEIADKVYRQHLFSNLLEFNNTLRKALNIQYIQWVNGSFTTHKPFPGDVDIVSFIDYDHFVRNGRLLNHLAMTSHEKFQIDVHFGTTSSKRHRFHERSMEDFAYWKRVFGYSRKDENMIKHPKGIIQLKF